jgi:hypothetical protein
LCDCVIVSFVFTKPHYPEIIQIKERNVKV